MILKCTQWLKQETLLVITFILAMGSTLVVAPSLDYLKYIDWDTLALLTALMIVVGGFKTLGLFSAMGKILLSRVSSQRSIEIVLISACFFSSMIITNDIALITFVPFAIETLDMANMEKKLIPVVVLQTIAANLGSMVTPIGNPQNIYLYFQSGFSALEFISLTLPYALVSFGLLMFFIHAKKNKPLEITPVDEAPFAESKEEKFKALLYTIMFLLCLLSLSKIIPVYMVAAAVVILAAVFDKKVIAGIDYSLLLTFANFFVFVGNMQHIPMLSDAIVSMVSGNELAAAIGISQVISNVPAVLLLTGFTNSWKMLIIGSNLGGLGTLIASMASLISYKYIAKECPDQKMKYLIIFTVANVIFLATNLLLTMFI